MPGKFHVIAFVHLDLCQTQGPLKLADHPIQVRSQGMAGGAPLRPKIRQDRALPGRCDDILLKSIEIHGKDVRVLAAAMVHDLVTSTVK
jgi:hypothetical protein